MCCWSPELSSGFLPSGTFSILLREPCHQNPITLLSSKTIASSLTGFHRSSFSRVFSFYISAGSLHWWVKSATAFHHFHPVGDLNHQQNRKKLSVNLKSKTPKISNSISHLSSGGVGLSSPAFLHLNVFPKCISQMYFSNVVLKCISPLNCISQMYFPHVFLKCISPHNCISQMYFPNFFLKCISPLCRGGEDGGAGE